MSLVPGWLESLCQITFALSWAGCPASKCIGKCTLREERMRDNFCRLDVCMYISGGRSSLDPYSWEFGSPGFGGGASAGGRSEESWSGGRPGSRLSWWQSGRRIRTQPTASSQQEEQARGLPKETGTLAFPSKIRFGEIEIS